MSPGDFCNWLEGLLNGTPEERGRLAVPIVTTRAQEVVGFKVETRESLVVCFPAGTFIVTVAKAAA